MTNYKALGKEEETRPRRKNSEELKANAKKGEIIKRRRRISEERKKEIAAKEVMRINKMHTENRKKFEKMLNQKKMTRKEERKQVKK